MGGGARECHRRSRQRPFPAAVAASHRLLSPKLDSTARAARDGEGSDARGEGAGGAAADGLMRQGLLSD
jgi:hypothetical protein